MAASMVGELDLRTIRTASPLDADQRWADPAHDVGTRPAQRVTVGHRDPRRENVWLW